MKPVDLAESIAKRVSNLVDEYIVSVTIRNSLMVKYANGEITVTQAWRDYIVGVYMAKQGKMTASTFTTRDPGEAVVRVAELLDKLQPSPLYAPLPQPTGRSGSVVDGRIKEFCLTGDPRIVVEEVDLSSYSNPAGMISLEYNNSYLMGSNGFQGGLELTSFSGYLRMFRGDDSGQWAWVSTRYEPRLALRAADKAEELARLCENLPKERVGSGTYRVLLSPMVAGNLMERVAFAASAGSVILGFSFLQGRSKGDIVASEKLTLRDIPLEESLPGYSSFDDEGIATINKAIIERGVFKGFLHNSKTARILGEQSTGNAGWILPRPFNLEIEGGTLREDELFEVLREGLYATNNWYTRFQNYLEGSFSTVTRDALIVIKGGRPVACSRRARLTGRLPELLTSIEELSRERWPIQWWEVDVPFILPHVIVAKLGVTQELGV